MINNEMKPKIRQLLTLGFTLTLVLTIPLFVWGMLTQRFDIRKRAATGEPGTCIPSGNTIYITPPGGAGNCHGVQVAIDSVPGPNYKIKFAPGVYRIPDSPESFSLKIEGKQNLILEGAPEQGSKAVTLEFERNGGGILVKNSSNVMLSWMQITGRTSNGIVRFENSPNSNLYVLHIKDDGANAIQIYNSHYFSITNIELQAMAGGITIGGSQSFTVANNKIFSTDNAIYAHNSYGNIFANEIVSNRESGIRLSSPTIYQIYQNTIVGNDSTGLIPSTAGIKIENVNQYTHIVNIYKNIIVNNNGGVAVDNYEEIDNFHFDRNDVWNNKTNYMGLPDQTGRNGNISQDPLLGENYCLMLGSPALYGVVAQGEYMGAYPNCSYYGVTPTPSPTTYASPTPYSSPTPTVWYQDLKFRVRFAGVAGDAADDAKISAKIINRRTGFEKQTPLFSVNHVGNGIYEAIISLVGSQSQGPQIPIESGYEIILKGEKHLARKFCQAQGQTSRCGGPGLIYIGATSVPYTQVFDFTGLVLEPGDLPVQDGVANAADFAKIKALLSKPASELTDNDKLTADLDYSGYINVRDAFLMRQTLETRYDED